MKAYWRRKLIRDYINARNAYQIPTPFARELPTCEEGKAMVEEIEFLTAQVQELKRKLVECKGKK